MSRGFGMLFPHNILATFPALKQLLGLKFQCMFAGSLTQECACTHPVAGIIDFMCGVMETWPRANEGKVTLKTRALGKINLNGNLKAENQLLFKWIILKIRFWYWNIFLKAVYVYVAETTVSLQKCVSVVFPFLSS